MAHPLNKEMRITQLSDEKPDENRHNKYTYELFPKHESPRLPRLVDAPNTLQPKTQEIWVTTSQRNPHRKNINKDMEHGNPKG